MASINWFAAAKLGHYFIEEVLRPGDAALDGTMGNGHDTLALARLVGPGGKVTAFDIQSQALENTQTRLNAAGVWDDRIRLVLDGHQHIKKYVTSPIRAAIFNLGYLPGGDHGMITRTETTLQALEQALDLLVPGGRLVVVVYPGHCGGDQEKEAVEQKMSGLAAQQFRVIKVNLLNRPATAPGVIMIEKAVAKREGTAPE
ncbi:tRNA (mnm(5)s(2)U34)-methyltransferase [Desulforamulus ruminis]|uniref:rRNA methylase n=1 Tax=Desulforamulus ruminis (strain ATCC 23193 / DSM 2154 / NCIMB 8452 / DL) TaxID=696281 RepID=F6DU90_DESRL|nr:class I SAM-dependent methyltransferase [Desulforamulus ruminis]AEG61275.1 rRNA methylase [Desulforamulus ruminis DSM 2154]